MYFLDVWLHCIEVDYLLKLLIEFFVNERKHFFLVFYCKVVDLVEVKLERLLYRGLVFVYYQKSDTLLVLLEHHLALKLDVLCFLADQPLQVHLMILRLLYGNYVLVSQIRSQDVSLGEEQVALVAELFLLKLLEHD